VIRDFGLSVGVIAKAVLAGAVFATLIGCTNLSSDKSAPLAKTATKSDAIDRVLIDERVKQVDEFLAETYKADAPGAVALVLHKGQAVLRKAYGLADADAKQPLAPDQLFRIGSVTKQFTAVAVLMLVDQGQLSLQDPVRKYLPHATQDDRITIEHLLTHTSGLPNYTDLPALRELRSQVLTFDQLINLTKDQPAKFAPGTRYDYSNTGYMLLGAVIEKATQQRYGDFLAERIFKPLGMDDTAVEGMERSSKRIVKGYRVQEGKFSAAPALQPTIANSAGAIVSTVDDMAKWDLAITQRKLLKAATWQRAMTPARLQSGDAIQYNR
jgi:D-alanyl-D-alanine carboxypeptidase